MRPVRPGRMVHHITLLEETGTEQDEHGSPIKIWSPVFVNLSAELNTGQGRAFFEAQQSQQELSHLIVIRAIPGMTTRRLGLMRIAIGADQVLEQLRPPLDRESAGRESTIYAREILNDHDSHA